MPVSSQMPLPLEPRRVASLADFVAGPNGAVRAAVGQVAREADQSLLISGPASSGKTHLLNAACLEARQAGRTAFFLGLRGLGSDDARSLEGLERTDLVCLDDLQEVAGEPVWEEALFHFINRLREAQGSLLLSSRERLRQLPLQLPDLASRLAWGLRLTLRPLEDWDKRQVIERHGAAMGVRIPDDVIDYLLNRGPRDMATLLGVISRLQQVAFRDKRQLTVPLTRELLRG